MLMTPGMETFANLTRKWNGVLHGRWAVKLRNIPGRYCGDCAAQMHKIGLAVSPCLKIYIAHPLVGDSALVGDNSANGLAFFKGWEQFLLILGSLYRQIIPKTTYPCSAQCNI